MPVPLQPTNEPPHGTPAQRRRAYAVHLYTASGVALAFLAAMEICRDVPDPRWAFLWLAAAVVVDATDGPLARACHVKFRAPRFDGRKIDDIVDYLTFTFLPLLLVWRLDWLPEPAVVWIIPALLASILGFANTSAKQEEAGFFLGFPSYWNIYAFYAGPLSLQFGPWVPAAILALLTLLTILPVRFLYPNLTPRPWRIPILAGAALWFVLLLAMLPSYPYPPAWLLWLSLPYPIFYLLLSFHLDRTTRPTSPTRQPKKNHQ